MQQSYCKIVSAIINTTFVSLYCTIRYVPAGGGEEEGARPGQGEQGGGLHGH